MIEVPQEFRPHICVSYPPSNHLIFEEWFAQQEIPQTDRQYLGIFWTSYLVNNGYGEEPIALQKLQDYVDSLPRYKSYYTIFQFDNGCMVDFKDLDIVTFGMSYRLPEQKPTYVIPLIGQMNEYIPVFNPSPPLDMQEYGTMTIYMPDRKYKANFVGSITHPLRKELVETLIGENEYYISTEPHEHSEYNRIMANSIFTFSPVGYGKNSFRHYESIHQQSIPVVIYEDEVMEPYGIDINEYGIKIHQSEISVIPEILRSYTPYGIEQKRKRMKELYPILCTYNGVYSQIIKTLQSE